MSQKEDEAKRRLSSEERELARKKALLDVEEPMIKGKMNFDFIKKGITPQTKPQAIKITRHKKGEQK